ncbi:MAG: MlaD family protein [Mariprofundaceae bacterium]
MSEAKGRGDRMRDFVAGMQRQVGWFVMIGLGAIVVLLLAVSLRTDVFASKFHLYFSPPSAAPFHEGQPVKFQGFTIGRVGDMALLEEGRVRITLTLLDRYRPMIHEGGRARIVKEGLIGEQVVEVTRGDVKRPVIQDGATVDYETEASIEQLLQDLKPAVSNANTLLAQLAELSVWLNDPDGPFRSMTARLNEATEGLTQAKMEQMVASLADTLARLDAIVIELDRAKVASHLGASVRQANILMRDIEPLARAAGEKGPETMANVANLLRHVDALSRSLDIVAADLSELTPELPGLARESKGAIREMRTLLEGMRGSWLFGGGRETGKGAAEGEIAPPVLELRP